MMGTSLMYLTESKKNKVMKRTKKTKTEMRRRSGPFLKSVDSWSQSWDQKGFFDGKDL